MTKSISPHEKKKADKVLTFLFQGNFAFTMESAVLVSQFQDTVPWAETLNQPDKGTRKEFCDFTKSRRGRGFCVTTTQKERAS